MTQQTAATRKVEASSGPWWRYGHMWLVLGGPAVVVLAGIATVVIATRGADTVIDANYNRTTVQAEQALQQRSKSMAPAQALRNHAATPDADLPPLEPQ